MQTNGPEAARSGHWLWAMMPTTEADLALSLLYVNKMVFHPVPDCNVFSLATQIPRCSGQQYSHCYSW